MGKDGILELLMQASQLLRADAAKRLAADLASSVNPVVGRVFTEVQREQHMQSLLQTLSDVTYLNGALDAVAQHVSRVPEAWFNELARAQQQALDTRKVQKYVPQARPPDSPLLYIPQGPSMHWSSDDLQLVQRVHQLKRAIETGDPKYLPPDMLPSADDTGKTSP